MAYYSSKLWGKKRAWNIEAFIAPTNFDPASQPLNIVTVFGDYNNANKAYIYSFTSAIATLTLPASSGITYRWGETISGVDYVSDVASGTAFTAGSTKRYVIVNSTASSLIANISIYDGFNGAVWLYCSSKCYQVSSNGNTYLNYVHCEDLNSVTTIGNTAFYHCSGLTGTLTIPDTVTSIGQNAFDGCSGLTGTLTIPNSVTSIGNSAFYNCTGLTGTLTIPASIRTIAENTFTNCGFNHIENYSNEFLVEDEVLYTASTITALYSPKKYSGTLTLKTNTTRIGYNCFGNNLRTGTLTIPSTVTTIGYGAFSGCSGLTGTLTISNSVTTIADYAFYGCSGLTGSLTIPNSVTTIGYSAFYNCTGLTGTLTIPDTVTTINGYTFYGCSGFTGTLTIPNSVTTINGYAFSGCSKLNGIATIGSGITTIGGYNFNSMTLVTEWHILSSVAPAVQSITWGNYAKPLHVKIGATGYNVAPWTNTAIFSSIIYDL